MMKTDNIIEIPFSKKKITLLFFGAIGFVAIGIWFVISPPSVKIVLLQNKAVVSGVGVVNMVFFGFCAVYAAKQLFETKPGLIIGTNSIIDNSSGISAGEIYWHDIESFKIVTIQKQKFLMIMVNDPHRFIDSQQGWLKRLLMKWNARFYGSPIAISSNSLDISFDELYKMLTERLAIAAAA